MSAGRTYNLVYHPAFQKAVVVETYPAPFGKIGVEFSDGTYELIAVKYRDVPKFNLGDRIEVPESKRDMKGLDILAILVTIITGAILGVLIILTVVIAAFGGFEPSKRGFHPYDGI